MASGYRFPILDSAGAVTTTVVDMEDMFVPKDLFLNAGIYSFGRNTDGQLGLNDVVHRSSPVQVGSLTNWKQISFGATYIGGVKTDGTLWSWGRNQNGSLGLNDLVHRSSPTQIGSLTTWSQVSVGSGFETAAIKNDGTLWTWGYNYGGILGLGDQTHRSSPTQVGALTNWKLVACSNYHSAAVTTDGALYAWGLNNGGQLGQSNITNFSSPVQVGTTKDWKLVSCGSYSATTIATAAVKTDGTLWAWGHNASGQLGLNDVTIRSSPVQIGTLNNWKQVSTNGFNTVAVKTDGTIWAWGHNGNGQLGLSDIVHRSSPVQIGALTNWKIVVSSNSGFHCGAIKTDGTLWFWGFNGNGQLGLSDATQRSSPVQVGSLTNWKQVSPGSVASAAISAPELP